MAAQESTETMNRHYALQKTYEAIGAQGIGSSFLKPCPFCGEAPNVFDFEHETKWAIECADMGCIMPRTRQTQNLVDLIESWNKRAL